MGTLKTSINIVSTDTLPFAVNQTVRTAIPTGEFVESGTKLVQPLTSASYVLQEGLVSTRDCGANGAYMFAQNPTTNTANILLFGASSVDNAVSASAGNFSNITGLQPLAILTPGDSLLVPVPASQLGVYAHTSYGTASLEYYLADRQGQFGQGGLVVTTTPTNYKYAVLDAQAGVLSQGNPTPYFTSIDLGVTSSFSYSLQEIANNKGYALKFTDNTNSSHVIYKFIDSKGVVVNTLDLTAVGDSTATLDEMGGYLVGFVSGSNLILNIFNGETLHTHTIQGSSWDYASDWDSTSADGTLALKIIDYLGVSGDKAVVLFNKQNYHVTSVENEGSTGLRADSVSTSFYGNFYFIPIYNSNTGIYTRFEIWSTDGVLLKDLDVSTFSIGDLSYILYGTNKLQVIASATGLDYLLNYNGATNHLIGHNSTNPQLPILNWSHLKNSTYQYRYFYAYKKGPLDSIRPSYYSQYEWNSGMFDAESMAIVYSKNANNQSSYHINSQTGFCDILYVMAGATDYKVHQVKNGGGYAYIRIPNETGYNRVTPSSNLIAFNYSTNNYESGSLQVLAITPTGVTSSSIAPKLEDIQHGNGDIRVAPVGDYIMYITYNPTTNKTTFTMFKSATKKPSLTFTGNNFDYYRRYNTLVVADYTGNKLWYFNTASNSFIELPNTLNWWDWIDVNRSTTTNGLNDGNQLMYPNSLNTTALAKARLIKQHSVTPEVPLPVTDGDFDIRLGSEAIFLMYQDMHDGYKLKVNIYDLDFNLVKVVPLNTTSYNDYIVLGKRIYIKVQDADQLLGSNYYGHYMISLKGMAYWLHADNDNVVFNDKFWWHYIY